MVFDIKSLGGLRGADKTKSKAKTGATGGPSFADMLDEAQDSGAAENASPLAPNFAVPGGFVPIEDELPRDAKGQARELLNTLKTLAEDALSGSPTATLDRLEALTRQVDESTLTADQKQALDEARTRAAVELAKIKG
ncbi:MAG: hypothetical protein DI585_00665 [Pseudomonas fluorescens]|nr:MAG: hypothetical protein DI585_00665 [Pseudomonas fluorescens]